MHPLREGFWFEAVEQAVALQEAMDGFQTTENNPKFREFLWHTATTTTKLEGLNGLKSRIKLFVFPIFAGTRQKAEMARALASSAQDTPAKG